MPVCVLVGIAGGSLSGKTSLAKAVYEEWKHKGVILLETKSYLKYEADEYHPDSYDWERLREEVQNILEKCPCKILIVEGALALWDDVIDDLCDVRVYTHCSSDLRLIRQIRKDTLEGRSLDETLEHYTNYTRARHKEFVAPCAERADLHVNTDESVDQAVWNIRKVLRGWWI